MSILQNDTETYTTANSPITERREGGGCDQLHEGADKIGRELQRENELGFNDGIELREQAHQIGHAEA